MTSLPLKMLSVLFRFPSDHNQRLQWLDNIGRDSWTPNDNSLVCSSHFIDECFDRCGLRVFLKKMAVPTIFTRVRVCNKINRDQLTKQNVLKSPILKNALS